MCPLHSFVQSWESMWATHSDPLISPILRGTSQPYYGMKVWFMILLSKVACSWDGSLLTTGFAPPWSGGAALPSPQVLRPDHKRRGGSRCPLQTVAVLKHGKGRSVAKSSITGVGTASLDYKQLFDVIKMHQERVVYRIPETWPALLEWIYTRIVALGDQKHSAWNWLASDEDNRQAKELTRGNWFRSSFFLVRYILEDADLQWYSLLVQSIVPRWLVVCVAHSFIFSTIFHAFLDAPGTLVGLPTAELADVSSDDAPVWMSEDDQVGLP